MKYLHNYNYYITEANYPYPNNYDIYDLEIDVDVAEDYMRNNYDWEIHFKSLGKEIFDFMGDYERNQYWEHLIDSFVKSTTYDDIADYDEDRLRDYIKDNQHCYDDKIGFDGDDFEEYIDKLKIEEIIKIFEDQDYSGGCNCCFKYDEAHSQYEHYQSIDELFEWVEKDEDYYEVLENYFDEDMAKDRLLENQDTILEFYLEDIQIDDKLKNDIIEYDQSNIRILFFILDKNNKYGKKTDFQIQYIDYVVNNDLIYDDGSVNKDDVIDLEKEINDIFGITTEAKVHLYNYVKKSKAKRFNL